MLIELLSSIEQYSYREAHFRYFQKLWNYRRFKVEIALEISSMKCMKSLKARKRLKIVFGFT